MSGNQEKKENQNMEQPPVIRLDRQLKYQGNILKIYEDVVLANGHKAHWDFIHHDGAAAVLPVADDGRILMVRQYRNALDKFTLEIPAGKLDDPKEPKIRCAFRELEAETGAPCLALAYPYGRSAEQTWALTEALGIPITFSTEPKGNTLVKGLPQSLLNLGRFTIDDISAADLLDLIA